MRTCLVLLACFVARLVPDFTMFMSFIGAFCCQLMAFILPAVFHLKACYITGEVGTPRAILDVFIVIFGVIFAVVGTIDALDALFSADGSSRGHAH